MFFNGSFAAFFRDRLVVFALLSAVFLSFMRYSGYATPFLLGVAFLLFRKEFKDGGWRLKEYRFLYLSLIFYAIWLLLSFVMHFAAMECVSPERVLAVGISKNPHTFSWGIKKARQLTQIYLFFPILYAMAVVIFKRISDASRWLVVLPIVFFPSLTTALYQGFVNKAFFNPTGYPPPGLGTTASSFGVVLFLIFPICILGLIRSRPAWKRMLFGLTIFVILVCVKLANSFSAMIGVFTFLVTLPFLWLWVNKAYRKGLLYKCLALVLCAAFLAIGFGFNHLENGKVKGLIASLESSGMEQAIENDKSGRLLYGFPAIGLTLLSPISGWGPGGFFRNLNNYQFINKKKRLRLHNAANHYLQMSSELGILGVIFNVLLHVFPLWMIFRVRKRIDAKEDRWAIGIVYVTVLILMAIYVSGPHGLALDVLWIIVIFLAFLFTKALRYGYSFDWLNLKVYLVSLILLTILFGWGVYQASFGKMGYAAMQRLLFWPPYIKSPFLM